MSDGPKGKRKAAEPPEETKEVSGVVGKRKKSEEQVKKERAANNAAAIRYRQKIKEEHEYHLSRSEQYAELVEFCEALDEGYISVRRQYAQLWHRHQDLTQRYQQLVLQLNSSKPGCRRLLGDGGDIDGITHDAFSVPTAPV